MKNPCSFTIIIYANLLVVLQVSGKRYFYTKFGVTQLFTLVGRHFNISVLSTCKYIHMVWIPMPIEITTHHQSIGKTYWKSKQIILTDSHYQTSIRTVFPL